MSMNKLASFAAAAVMAVGIAGNALADVTISQVLAPGSTSFTWPGSDCAGTLGGNFAACSYNGSPIIGKFNFEDGKPGQVELNTAAFPGLQASWFTIDPVKKTWKYDPQGAGPGITAFASKAGNNFFVYTLSETYFGGSQVFEFLTPEGKGLSHISFYDTKATVVPLPAGAWLMLSGLAGLGLLSRRKRVAA